MTYNKSWEWIVNTTPHEDFNQKTTFSYNNIKSLWGYESQRFDYIKYGGSDYLLYRPSTPRWEEEKKVDLDDYL